MYINSVAKHPRNLNYSTKHVYNAQRLKSTCRSLGVSRKHECISMAIRTLFSPALKEFQSRLLVVRLQRVKRDFYLGKHQIKPSLI